MYAIIIFLILWNVIVFFLYALDKYKAKNKERRISEKALLIPAFLMGSFGAVLGSIICRHKTKKIKFKVLLPIAFIFNIGLIFLLPFYF